MEPLKISINNPLFVYYMWSKGFDPAELNDYHLSHFCIYNDSCRLLRRIFLLTLGNIAFMLMVLISSLMFGMGFWTDLFVIVFYPGQFSELFSGAGVTGISVIYVIANMIAFIGCVLGSTITIWYLIINNKIHIPKLPQTVVDAFFRNPKLSGVNKATGYILKGLTKPFRLLWGALSRLHDAARDKYCIQLTPDLTGEEHE